MSNLVRMISIPVLAAVLFFSAGCGPATVSVGGGDGYYDDYRYGDRRLPLGYFYYTDYYDGMWNDDYVCYGDSWYYHGYDTPYYYDDPYYW
jgi:hypothetical protein